MLKDFETYFTSQEYINALAKTGVEPTYGNLASMNGRFMELAITYAKITATDTSSFNTEGLTRFLYTVADRCRTEGYSNFETIKENSLAEVFAHTFKISQESLQDEETTHRIKKTIWNRIADNSYKIHRTNSSALDGIRANGITPDREFKEIDDIRRVDAIFKSHNMISYFGWLDKNCDGKVFYSRTFQEAYRYSIRSPEWFASFTGDYFHDHTHPEFTPNAFSTRNHDGARRNVELLIENKGFSEEEKAVVLNFFEDCWQTYGTATPTIIIAPEGFTENGYLNTKYDQRSVAGFIGQATRFVGGCVDASTNETIDTSNATYASTYPVAELQEKIEEAMANNVFDLEAPEEELLADRELEELDGTDISRIFLSDDYTGEVALDSI